jgi:RNA polymerase sigma-70 factor (ECF subfamily)
MTDSARPASDPASQLISEFGEELRRYAAALVGPDRADDVVQDTYLRLRRSLQKARPENPKAFAFRIAANLARDELRRGQRHGELDRSIVEDEPTQAASAGEMAVLDEQLERVRRAVERLPEKCRRVFILRRVEQHSYAEIAALEGISQKTVENQVGRALKLIRASLQEQEH